MQRDTIQRSAIREVFEGATRPLSPEEILDKARKIVPKLGQATVYRTIIAMQQDKLIVPVDIPGQSSRYEKAGLKHHHHFVCSACEKVYELAGCSYTGDGESHLPEGFTVEGHEVILYGRCNNCRRP